MICAFDKGTLEYNKYNFFEGNIMLKDRRGDAPKIVNIGVWTTAVVAGFVFALTVGIGLYNTVNTPISASSSIASCPTGTQKMALNNYPTNYFKSTFSYLTFLQALIPP